MRITRTIIVRMEKLFRWRVNYRTQRSGWHGGGSRNYRGDAVHARAAAMARLHYEDPQRSRSFISGNSLNCGFMASGTLNSHDKTPKAVFSMVPEARAEFKALT